MKSPWKVENIRMQSGEIYPLLVCREDGIPLFKPTVYITSMVRNAGKAESTSEANLRAIMFLYFWGNKNGIEIETRFRKGEFLMLHEIEMLSKDVRYRYCRLNSNVEINDIETRSRRRARSGVPLRQRREKEIHCNAHSAGIRLRYIRNYLDWLAGQRMARTRKKSEEYFILKSNHEKMIKEINARLPESVRGVVRDPVFERLGLSHDVEKILIEVVDPQSSRNPFKQEHARVRNQVIIMMMLETGLRRGETLGIRTTDGDLDLQKNRLTVHRVPIDPLDPRLHKPQTKTLPRILPLQAQLAKLVRDYILNYRRKLPAAGSHPFLFVESRQGTPLTLAALNDVFVKLREVIPELPTKFSPHFTRYTWNDRFSEFSDEKIRRGEWTETQEKETRSYLMGWSKDSLMASLYCKRHTRTKANEFSLRRQEDIFKSDAE